MKTTRRRILHVLGGLGRGGAEAWIIQALPKLIELGHDVDLLVFSEQEQAYTQEARRLGARVLSIHSARGRLGFVQEVTKVIRENGPYDVVHSHIWLASGLVMYAAAKSGVICRIVQSHNVTDRYRKTWLRKLYALSMRILIRRYASQLVAVTNKSGEALFGRMAWSQRGTIVPPSIDLTPFRRTYDNDEVRREFGFRTNEFVVGHVGSFTPQKNHAKILSIFNEVVKKGPDYRLLLIGDGSLLKSMYSKARQLGIESKVVFAGTREDVPRIMNGAMDLLLFPSNWEGLGRVVVEAQAAGKPCVISDVVPEEAGVVPQLVARVSLTDSDRKWADTIDEVRTSVPVVQKSVAFEQVVASQMNIDESLGVLVDLYKGSECR